MKYNRTTLYLLPSISPKKKEFNLSRLEEMGFVNVYSYWEDRDEENYLYLLFTPSKTRFEEWSLFRELYITEPNYVEDHFFENETVVLVFNIDPKYKGIKNSFLKGKYSDLGNKYATEFLDIKQGGSTQNKQYKVIKRDEAYRKELSDALDVYISPMVELDEIPIKEDETLIINLNKYDYNG